nr:YfhO family protein [Lachnospiraceae bacterium]
MTQKDAIDNTRISKNSFLLVGVVIVALVHIVVMLINNCAPFGNTCLNAGDNLAEILPFIEELKSKISEGESLAYSFGAHGGGNYYYIFVYTLANP